MSDKSYIKVCVEAECIDQFCSIGYIFIFTEMRWKEYKEEVKSVATLQ